MMPSCTNYTHHYAYIHTYIHIYTKAHTYTHTHTSLRTTTKQHAYIRRQTGGKNKKTSRREREKKKKREGKKKKEKKKKRNSHLQLRDLDAPVPGREVVAVAPLGVEELGAVDDDLAELDAGAGGDLLGDGADARAEAEHEARVRPVQHQVPAREEDLARCRDGDRGGLTAGRWW